MTLEERESLALNALRRLSRRKSFQRVFVEVCKNYRDASRSPSERGAWGDIEDAIRIDLRRRHT